VRLKDITIFDILKLNNNLLQKEKDNISGCLRKEQTIEKQSELNIFL